MTKHRSNETVFKCFDTLHKAGTGEGHKHEDSNKLLSTVKNDRCAYSTGLGWNRANFFIVARTVLCFGFVLKTVDNTAMF